MFYDQINFELFKMYAIKWNITNCTVVNDFGHILRDWAVLKSDIALLTSDFFAKQLYIANDKPFSFILCLYICLFIYLFIYLCIYLFITYIYLLFIYSFHLFIIYQFIYLFIYLFMYLFIYLITYLFINVIPSCNLFKFVDVSLVQMQIEEEISKILVAYFQIE